MKLSGTKCVAETWSEMMFVRELIQGLEAVFIKWSDSLQALLVKYHLNFFEKEACVKSYKKLRKGGKSLIYNTFYFYKTLQIFKILCDDICPHVIPLREKARRTHYFYIRGNYSTKTEEINFHRKLMAAMVASGCIWYKMGHGWKEAARMAGWWLWTRWSRAVFLHLENFLEGSDGHEFPLRHSVILISLGPELPFITDKIN